MFKQVWEVLGNLFQKSAVEVDAWNLVAQG
jgi:hypothetical protein